ncbi:MAG: hypothetical protein ACYSWQ_18745 [Planctomycetota bacterium]|jgi:hypothetical protein
MTLDNLKNRKELVGAAMLAVAVLSAVLIGTKVTGYFLASANAEDTVKQAIEQSKPDDKNVEAQAEKFRKVADALIEQNLFSPPAPRRHPVAAVMGIFGDEALINGKWYKAGDKVVDAKILAVDATSVTVEWDGKTRVFNPIDGGSSSGPSGPSRSRSITVSRGPSSSKTGRPQMVVTKSTAGAKSPKGDSLAVKMMTKTSKGMSDSQKETFKKAMQKNAERYEQMSSEEKTAFKAKMIKKIGGEGGRITIELKAK